MLSKSLLIEKVSSYWSEYATEAMHDFQQIVANFP